MTFKYFENVKEIKRLEEENKKLKEDMLLDRDNDYYLVVDIKGRTTINYKEFFDKYYKASKHDLPTEKIGKTSQRLILK